MPPVPSALVGLTSGFGKGPGVSPSLQSPEESLYILFLRTRTLKTEQKEVSIHQYPESKPSRISSSSLKRSRALHVYPIKVMVYHRAYSVNLMGDIILGHASHLDAFSGYHCRTWLPSDASGETTGTPAVRPPRSSRTRGSSPQIPCAHTG